MSDIPIIAQRRHTHVFDRGTDHWRGGQVWAVNGATATIRLRAEQHINHDYSVATSLLPNATVKEPIVARLTGTFPYAVAEVLPSHYANSGDALQARTGEFVPAVVPRSITGETETLPQ